MRILLTGAAGFVGSHVTRALLAASHEVITLIRPSTDTWRIDDILPQVTIINGDLADHSALKAALTGKPPDLCLHLAWYAEHGKYWHSPRNLELIGQTLALLQLLASLGCLRFVGTGTCVEYDITQGYLDEATSVLYPASLYAASKLSAYYLTEHLGRQIGVQTAWLRLFYIYGPMESPNRLIPYVINSLLAEHVVETTSGEQVRDYLHITDAASGLCTAALSDVQGAVNIASSEPIAVKQVVQDIAQLIGGQDLLRLGAKAGSPGDPSVIYGNSQRLRELGWRPRYTLKEGLVDTIGWWKKCYAA